MIEGTEAIAESENWRQQDTFSYKKIVLNQVSRITSLGSKELTSGYWKRVSIAGGSAEMVTSYVDDSREGYINAVKVLYDLLQPKFCQNEVRQQIEVLFEEEKKTLEEFRQREKAGEKVREKWVDLKAEIYRKIFQALCCFLENLGWLESGISEE